MGLGENNIFLSPPTFDEEPADWTWPDLPVRGIFDLALFQIIVLLRHTKGTLECFKVLPTNHASKIAFSRDHDLHFTFQS